MQTDLLALLGIRLKNYVDSCIDYRQVLLMFTEVIDDFIYTIALVINRALLTAIINTKSIVWSAYATQDINLFHESVLTMYNLGSHDFVTHMHTPKPPPLSDLI